MEREMKAMIRKLALDSGFKLKRQPNGSQDLNPYVYDFAEALIIECFKQFEDAQAAQVMSEFAALAPKVEP